eukprot:3581017-Prymnesium_polylepis.1
MPADSRTARAAPPACRRVTHTHPTKDKGTQVIMTSSGNKSTRSTRKELGTENEAGARHSQAW